jgi:hypothetical protein
VRSRSLAGAMFAAVAAVAVSWSANPAPAAASSASALVGTFELTAGSCAHGAASGTYLQMILPSGSSSGPYMSNSDSACSNQAYTPLSAGTDGGLVTGSYQPSPQPPFTSSGNARAERITAPAQYEGTAFATATAPTDPQTSTKVAAPTVTDHDGRLTADLRSFAVTWNNQNFNQGSPKPDGSYPGNTKPATGTYDASTGAFTLSWTSEVVGGPFDKFTGKWHLAGRFVPAAGSGSSTRSSAHSSGHGAGTTTGSAGHSSASTTSHGSAATTGSGSPGGAALPGSASKVSGSSAAGALAPEVAGNGAPSAASTTTVTHESWNASWWLIVLAAAIAVLGFGALIGINRLQRRTNASSPAVAS